MTGLTKEDADLTQQLFDAIREGDMTTLDRFINDHATQHSHLLGLGFLFACREERLEVVKKLLDHVNPNTRSADGGTGLTLAAVGRNQHLVSLLLERGCDPNLVDNIGRTALHWGALSGRDANIRILLKCGVSVNAQDKNQWTPLMHAATRNFALVVHQLVHAGADTMKSNSMRMCALHLAVHYDCLPVVKTLIPFYSSLNPLNRWDETPLFIAVTRKNVEITRTLLATKRVDLSIRTNRLGHFGPLEMAAKLGHLEIVRLLLDSNCPPDPRPGPSGDRSSADLPLSALMHAAKNDEPKMVEILLKAGANPNWYHPNHMAESFQGPLHMAAKRSPFNMPYACTVLEQLLEAGARVDGPCFGRAEAELVPTPLVLAANESNAQACRLLLRHGACPDAPFPQKVPAILRLLSRSNKLGLPVDVSTEDFLQEFCHIIPRVSNRKVISLLPDRGGDVSLRKGIINLFSAYELPDFEPSVDLSPSSPYYRLLKNYLMDILLQPEFSQPPADVFRGLGLLPKPLVYTVLRDEMLVARTITSGNLHALAILIHGLVDFSREFPTLYPRDPLEFAIFADNLSGALLIAMAGGSLRVISAFRKLQYKPKVLKTASNAPKKEPENLSFTLTKRASLVPSLKELCRLCVRKHLEPPNYLCEAEDWIRLDLPLPDQLKIYLSILFDKEAKLMFDFLLRAS